MEKVYKVEWELWIYAGINYLQAINQCTVDITAKNLEDARKKASEYADKKAKNFLEAGSLGHCTARILSLTDETGSIKVLAERQPMGPESNAKTFIAHWTAGVPDNEEISNVDQKPFEVKAINFDRAVELAKLGLCNQYVGVTAGRSLLSLIDENGDKYFPFHVKWRYQHCNLDPPIESIRDGDPFIIWAESNDAERLALEKLKNLDVNHLEPEVCERILGEIVQIEIPS